MPCFTVRRTTVNMEVANLDLLALAFKGVFGVQASSVRVENGSVKGRHEDGEVVWSGGKLYVPATVDADAFKRSYAAECVKEAAKKQRWHVQAQGANRYLVTKGGW